MYTLVSDIMMLWPLNYTQHMNRALKTAQEGGKELNHSRTNSSLSRLNLACRHKGQENLPACVEAETSPILSPDNRKAITWSIQKRNVH